MEITIERGRCGFMKRALVLFAIIAALCIMGCGRSDYYEEEDDAAALEQERLERERAVLAANAKRSYEQVCSRVDSKLETRPDDMKGAIEEYEKFPSEYRSTQYWGYLKTKIKKLKTSIKGIDKFEELKQEIDDLMEEGKYKEAYGLINEFEIDYPGVFERPLMRIKAELDGLINENE